MKLNTHWAIACYAAVLAGLLALAALIAMIIGFCTDALASEPSRHSIQPADEHLARADSVSYFYAPRTTIVDAGLVGKAFVVVYRQTSALAWKKQGKVGSVPDRVWKDVYVARGDSIVFERRIEGRIVPPETVPERIEWGK